MQVYRIEREKYLPDVLSGGGAQLSSGNRWNSFGTRMVYCSQHRSLAMLELAVHLDLAADLPTDRWLVSLEIPDDMYIQSVDPDQLPPNWADQPPGRPTQWMGDQFVLKAQAAVLCLPSAIIAEEYNFLINPLHPEAQNIQVVGQRPILIDQRLQRDE